MRKAIIIGEEPKKESKDIEFTKILSIRSGWKDRCYEGYQFEKIVYLGKCDTDGDMFACYLEGEITIHKGNLNDGTY